MIRTPGSPATSESLQTVGSHWRVVCHSALSIFRTESRPQDAPFDFQPEPGGHLVPATLINALLLTQGVFSDRPALRTRRSGNLSVFQKRRTAAYWRARTERPLSSSDSHTHCYSHRAYFMFRQGWLEAADGWLYLNVRTTAMLLSLTVWAFAAGVPYAAMAHSPTRKSSSA